MRNLRLNLINLSFFVQYIFGLNVAHMSLDITDVLTFSRLSDCVFFLYFGHIVSYILVNRS